MLIDPLGNDPVVVSGSANFSNASTTNNDENMLVVRSDSRISDIYLGEFMRLFNQFYSRDYMDSRVADKTFKGKYLDPTDGWVADYYKEGSSKEKERLYFAG
jgi:phosphatidylserine/phosphatidylglycerophosphate/cardiolipin synthase-like enzyme